jgi:NAD(P)-dependent dehydrogenase (short-subunit alcohol dehydrogenase family)
MVRTRPCRKPASPRIQETSIALPNTDGRHAVVFGGEGELGGAVAGALHAAGWRVVVGPPDAPPGSLDGSAPGAAIIDLSLALDPLFAELDPSAGWRERLDLLMRRARAGADAGAEVIVLVTFTGHFATGGDIGGAAALKAAVVGATRGLAVELGPRNVRVISVSPGAILTRQAQERLAALSDADRERRLALAVERTPLRRLGLPRDVGEMCAFLVSPKASFITGVDLVVDGGLLCLNRTFSYNPPAVGPSGPELVSSERPIALVTGAARGIGQAVAYAFADAGYDVVVNDLAEVETATTVGEVEHRGTRALGIAADVSDADEVARMFAQVGRELGPVEVVVNNAAYYDFGCAMTQPVEAWARTWSVDVSGIFNTARAALPHMLHLGRGVIVNIASTNAFVTIPQNSAYAAAKSGVVGLTRALALELGPYNIRVVDVSPGFTATDAVRLYLDALSDERREQEMGGYYSMCPLGRLGEPREIADTCVFLASDRASFIHGTDVSVDGGMWAVNKVFSYNP